jgi:hypothetical protein
MAISGTLLDVFEITGRGCIALVDSDSRDCRAGDMLSVNNRDWEIIGIDIPRHSLETIERMEDGWRPPLALLLKKAEKAELISLIGQECSSTDSGGMK